MEACSCRLVVLPVQVRFDRVRVVGVRSASNWARARWPTSAIRRRNTTVASRVGRGAGRGSGRRLPYDIGVLYKLRVEGSHREEGRAEIAESLQQIAVLVVRYLADRQGLAFTSVLVLSLLAAEGPMRLTAVAAAEGVSQPSMSQLVQRLERQGLAARVSDGGDGRAALVAITDAGRALMAERQEALGGRMADLLAALSAEEEASLRLAMHVSLPIIQRMVRIAAHRDPHRHRSERGSKERA
ncbi:MAG: MarR family transcriptional regulator [Pseudonocardia sp.]|nr:MarR family transcriptional regulator [Pseudonocardia sp.]